MKKFLVVFALFIFIGCGGNDTTIDGKMWSSMASSYMKWQDAVDYCDNLNESGYSDWHLPTISELRTLIKNCPGSQTGGSCGVTDSCLSGGCVNDACGGCDFDESGGHSKLGDTDCLWSSSIFADNTDTAWIVSFNFGYLNNYYKTEPSCDVRCVRNSTN